MLELFKVAFQAALSALLVGLVAWGLEEAKRALAKHRGE
jgi:hypothetical protein